MDNTDLFNFKFVDREIERKVIRQFLTDANVDKVLWISGESGVGKTELIKYFKNQFPHYQFVYARPTKTQVSSYLTSLTRELDKEHLSFPKFILQNYKSIASLTKDTVSEINLGVKFLSGIIEIGEKVFVNAKGEYFSAASVITKYIKYISKKQKYIFVFDNFQQCDEGSLEVIQEITKNLLHNDKTKFIFITTDNTISSDSDITKFLLEKLSSIPIIVEPFRQKEYFLDILLNIYSLEEIDSNEIEQLFRICNGVPEKLKNFLRNMYLSSGIDFYKGDTYARFIPEVFTDTLSKGADFADLSSLSLLGKVIFKIAVCWNEAISIFMLNDVTMLVVKEALHLPQELYPEIINNIYTLLNLNILELDEKGLKLKHDLLYLSNLSEYNPIPEGILYKALYQYINTHKQEIIETYSHNYFLLNNALYAFKAKIPLWEQINMESLKCLSSQPKFSDTLEIINRLETSLTNLETSDLLYLADCFYDNGKYTNARDILTYTQSKLCADNDFFRYYYLSGKLYNMAMDKNNAETELLSAQRYATPNSDQELQAKHMLQIVLVEVIGRKPEAKTIFCSVADNLENYSDKSKVLGNFLKDCSNYYYGKEALGLLEKAAKICIANNDIIELAFIRNNMGYEYFKLDNYEKCKELYQQSIDVLSQTKIHESAYPLSNLAVCYMIDGEYQEAINLIKRALFWNRSSYLNYVLNTHLMLCYERIDQKDESIKIAKFLYEKMENQQITDPVVLRKVYLNLAINYDKVDMTSLAQKCAKKAYDYSIDTSSEYRASKIYSKYDGHPMKDLSQMTEHYYTRAYFDHWLTIFSHD